VPRGFVFDFASIPKIFWSLIGAPATGKYREAAVVHDYCYYSEAYSRWGCDRLFLQQMEDLDVPWWKRIAIYWAVRLFGWISWKKKRKEGD